MRRAAGFTLKELLIVVGLIGLIDSMLLVVIPRGKPRPPWQVAQARSNMQMMRSAIENYKTNVGSFPPDTDPSGKLNAAELLNKHLAMPIVIGGKSYGPYFYGGYSMDRNNNGVPELGSPAGGIYEYKLLLNADGTVRGFLVVDPGMDQQLGGMIDPQKGFVRSSTITNPKIKTDDQDNIYSSDANNFNEDD